MRKDFVHVETCAVKTGIMPTHSLVSPSVEIPYKSSGHAHAPQNYLNWSFVAWTSTTQCSVD